MLLRMDSVIWLGSYSFGFVQKWEELGLDEVCVWGTEGRKLVARTTQRGGDGGETPARHGGMALSVSWRSRPCRPCSPVTMLLCGNTILSSPGSG